MRYYVTFQKFDKTIGRPIDHPGASDFETDGTGMIPNVGDFVYLQAIGNEHAPTYNGRVKSRLFIYNNELSCGINIVVEETDDDWGELIKE